MKKLLASIAIGTFMLSSCGSGEHPSEQKNQKDSVAVAEEDHHHHEHSEEIQLNKGEKWKVDANMMVHIDSMKRAIHLFDTNTQGDLQTLAQQLQGHIDNLTSNCTMTGQAHDELHKWLLPFIDLTEEFAAETDQEKAQHLFAEIKTSFETFDTFFE